MSDDIVNMDAISIKKNNRAKQFSFRETQILKEMMEVKHCELNAKHQNGKKHCDKIWADITDAVNAVGNCPRTVRQVKEKWRNMMKKAKAEYSAERVSIGKTGGGPALPEMSQTSNEIVNFMKDMASFSGMPGASGSNTLTSSELVNASDQKLVDDDIQVSNGVSDQRKSIQSENRDNVKEQKRAESHGRQAVQHGNLHVYYTIITEWISCI